MPPFLWTSYCKFYGPICMTISRHTLVCQHPRKQKKTCGTQVCYLLVPWSCQIQPSVSPKLLNRFLPNLYIILPYICMTLHIKIKENWFSFSWDTCSWKLPNFLHIVLLLCTKLQIYLSRIKIMFSRFNFF